MVYGTDLWHVVHADLTRVDLDLYGAPGGVQLEPLLARLEGEGREVLAATNAGIFDTEGAPLGLFVGQGQAHPLNTLDGEGNFYLKPNGVFSVDDSGAHVVSTADFQATPRLATQSGPLLLLGGQVHPEFRPESPNRLLRSGICASEPWRVHLALSVTEVRFHDMATFFRDRLHCADALYLDGVISFLHTRGSAPDPGTYGGILVISQPATPGALKAP